MEQEDPKRILDGLRDKFDRDVTGSGELNIMEYINNYFIPSLQKIRDIQRLTERKNQIQKMLTVISTTRDELRRWYGLNISAETDIEKQLKKYVEEYLEQLAASITQKEHNNSNEEVPLEWTSKGLYFFELERYDEAIVCFDKAINTDPSNSKAWSNKGLSLQRLGKFNEAMECYDNALAIDPNREATVILKAGALQTLGRYNEAIKYYDKYLERYPNDAVLWSNKGISLRHLDKPDEAISCFDKAIKIDPNNAHIWIDKGFVLGALQKYNEAIECFDKAVKIDPNATDIWYEISDTIIVLGIDKIPKYYSRVKRYHDRAKKLGYSSYLYMM